MLAPHPDHDRHRHQAYVLDRRQLDALERAGALVALGELDAARAILADTLPARSLDRTTPLDVDVVGRARALALAALTAEHAHALPPLEMLSLTQRDVSAQAERTFVGRAMRIDRLVHHRAPAMRIDNEIALLHEAVERLDAREAPAGIDDELGFLPDDVITRLADAGFTLSLGGFAGVIAEVADARRRANDEASGPEELAFGRPLLASDVEDDDVHAWRAWTVIEGGGRAERARASPWLGTSCLARASPWLGLRPGAVRGRRAAATRGRPDRARRR